MSEIQQFVRVDFHRFKAFRSFKLHLRSFNILVGPNNAGKSTILASFRMLSAGVRRATQRKARLIAGPEGRRRPGHLVDLSAVSVAEENIFFDYDESESASVTFRLSNKGTLTLWFPEPGTCYLFPDHPDRDVATPSTFERYLNCPIGFVPILGPVEHNEPLYQEGAARRALYSYQAARNFRNIWYHYREHFDEFRSLLRETWPGMDIEPPKTELSHDKAILYMFCPEGRIPREIFWAGFGFQVWCQMLTHLVQSREASIFLIDEPDIYLHSDLQRQLLSLLKNLGPDILLATHSTEIIGEADADDLVVVDKRKQSARRIRDPAELAEVFALLGSNLNPVLTQLAKTRRVVFVEGKDFQVLSRFARKLGETSVANRSQFAVVPIGGCDPERIRSMKKGMEATLGVSVLAAAILDRDFRPQQECDQLAESCRDVCDLAVVHGFKEIENALLVPTALDRAAQRRIAERSRRGGEDLAYSPISEQVLEEFGLERKSYITSQRLTSRRRFWRTFDPGQDEASVNQAGLEEVELEWRDAARRTAMLPGKEVLGFLNQRLQGDYGVSLTVTSIIGAMTEEEVPAAIRELIEALADFSRRPAGHRSPAGGGQSQQERHG